MILSDTQEALQRLPHAPEAPRSLGIGHSVWKLQPIGFVRVDDLVGVP
jgi:hypothetical protein